VRLAASLGLCAVSFFHGRLYPDMRLAPLDIHELYKIRIEARQVGRETGVTVRFARSRSAHAPRGCCR
jgi:hypothetical protein